MTKKCTLIIYKVVNRVNNKSYIGMTMCDVQTRWSNHVSDSKRGSDLPFHRAIRKYGSDNFDVQIIDHASDIESAGVLESSWILKLGTRIDLNGYNVSTGGTGGNFYYQTLDENQRRLHNLKISKSKIGCVPNLSNEVRLARSDFMKLLNLNGRAFRRSGFKKLLAVSPDRQIFRTNAIPDFCREHNLPYGSVLRFARGEQKKKPKDWWFAWDESQDDTIILERAFK